MSNKVDTTEIEAEAEAAFAVDVARSKSLPGAIALWGRKPVFMLWRMGWCTGKSAGLEHAKNLFTDGH